MNPPKHPSSWNPPNHSHWRPDDWAFFFWSNYEPVRQLYFFLGCNYHSYRQPDDCTFFFQVVFVNMPKHPSLWWDHNRISPTDGQTTVVFFSGCNYEPAETSELVEPPQTFPLMARRLSLFSGSNYEPARRLYLFYFKVIIISPTKGQTTAHFFSGCNYEPAKTSELVEPPQPFPLTARQLSLFFLLDVIMNPPDIYIFIFSGRNHHSYRQTARQLYLFYGLVWHYQLSN